MSQIKPQYVKPLPPQFASREMRDDYYRAVYEKRNNCDLGSGSPGKPDTVKPDDTLSMDIPWTLAKLVVGTVLFFKFFDRLARLLWNAFAFVTLVTILIIISGFVLA